MDTPDVQLAYLIVAHYQPRHLARLIRATNHPGAAFFIHVDAKASLEEYTSIVPAEADATFIADRIPVTWGEVSLTEAILKLLRLATASGRPFRYFTALSGSDYPIKRAEQIHTRLAAATQEFLRIDRRLTFDPDSQFDVLRGIADQKFYRDLVPWHGSMHWALSAACIRMVLAYTDANPGFLAMCRDVFCPEEVYFHSIIKQSPFAAAIAQDYSASAAPDNLHHGVHFIDWQGLRPRSLRLNLDMRDLGILLASSALFARKFDEVQSRDVLGMLDRYVHRLS